MFRHLVPCTKWSKKYGDVQKGDVVLQKETSLVDNMYRLVKAKEAVPAEDGHIRCVLLE